MKKISTTVVLFFSLMFPILALAQWNPDTLNASSNLPGGSIIDIVASIMQWILVIFGFVAIIGFVISGIIYLTSAGDDERIETAKRAMNYSIIGVIVALSGLVIIYAVTYALTGATSFF